MFSTMLLIHSLLASVFALFLFVKLLFLYLSPGERFKKIHNDTKKVNIFLSILVLGTGIYIASEVGWGNLMGWMHMKLTLIAIGIPVSIIGFNKGNKAIATSGTLIFLYILSLAFTKQLMLWF